MNNQHVRRSLKNPVANTGWITTAEPTSGTQNEPQVRADSFPPITEPDWLANAEKPTVPIPAEPDDPYPYTDEGSFNWQELKDLIENAAGDKRISLKSDIISIQDTITISHADPIFLYITGKESPNTKVLMTGGAETLFNVATGIVWFDSIKFISNGDENYTAAAIFNIVKCKQLICTNCEFENNKGIEAGVLKSSPGAHDLIFKQCQFSNNTSAQSDIGNGPEYLDPSDLKIMDGNNLYCDICNFYHSTSADGFYHIAGYKSFMFINRCVFQGDFGNTASGCGGIYAEVTSGDTANAWVAETTFERCWSRFAGAIQMVAPGDPGITSGVLFAVNNSTFDQCMGTNTAATPQTIGGGAIRASKCAIGMCDFGECELGAGYGGAVYGDEIYLIDVRLNQNKVLDLSGGNKNAGGAVYATRSLDMIQCELNYNSAESGGGIAYNCSGDSVKIKDSSFYGNTATTSGGAIYNLDSTGMFGMDKIADGLDILYIDDDVIFENNRVQSCSLAPQPDLERYSESNIFATKFTDPFTYPINNNDIGYTRSPTADTEIHFYAVVETLGAPIPPEGFLFGLYKLPDLSGPIATSRSVKTGVYESAVHFPPYFVPTKYTAPASDAEPYAVSFDGDFEIRQINTAHTDPWTLDDSVVSLHVTADDPAPDPNVSAWCNRKITITPSYELGHLFINRLQGGGTGGNQYVPEIPGIINAHGKPLKYGELQFEVFLEDDPNTPVATATNDEFGNIVFDNPLVFSGSGESSNDFIFKMIGATDPEWSIDPTEYHFNITTQCGDLVIGVKACNPVGKVTIPEDIIINTTYGKPNVANGSIEFSVRAKVELVGGTLVGNDYLIGVYSKTNPPELVGTATNDATGYIDFSSIPIDTEGVRHYIVKQIGVNDPTRGLTRANTLDKSEYDVMVITYCDFTQGLGCQLSNIVSTSGSLVFINRIGSQPGTPGGTPGCVWVKAHISAMVNACGCARGAIAAGLYDENNCLVATGGSNNSGSINFPALAFNTPGIYCYRIRPIGSKAVLNSSRVCVRVVKNSAGKLVTRINYPGGIPVICS